MSTPRRGGEQSSRNQVLFGGSALTVYPCRKPPTPSDRVLGADAANQQHFGRRRSSLNLPIVRRASVWLDHGVASILAVMLDDARPQGRPRMHPCRPLRRAILTLSAMGLLVVPPAVRAQDGLRYGISFGGTGFIGVVGEWRSRDHGAELLLSTFTFRDLSISVAGRRYFGASSLRPSVGAGLWFVVGTAPEGTGTALVARFPLGGDWQAAGGHYATFELNVNRSIWVNRPELTDEAPTTARLIPLPSVSYRYDPD